MERTMMIRTKHLLLTTLLTAAMATPAFAYDNIVTHRQFTLHAVQKSVLYQDGSILKNLGLLPASKQRYLYRARALDWTWGMPSVPYDIQGLIAEGTYDEDAFPLSLNHF